MNRHKLTEIRNWKNPHQAKRYIRYRPYTSFAKPPNGEPRENGKHLKRQNPTSFDTGLKRKIGRAIPGPSRTLPASRVTTKPSLRRDGKQHNCPKNKSSLNLLHRWFLLRIGFIHSECCDACWVKEVACLTRNPAGPQEPAVARIPARTSRCCDDCCRSYTPMAKLYPYFQEEC